MNENLHQESIVFCWSGGKDSAYALHRLLEDGSYDMKYLLSTFHGNHKRLSMHGVREELIQAQADSIGIPLLKVFVHESNNDEYEKKMAETLLGLKEEGIATVAFGDILLEDLRRYREEQNNKLGMKSIFPLWKMDTAFVVQDFLSKGFQTITCCVSDEYLNKSYCGRIINDDFINELPPNVDPCGENGEYHSFCFDGPLFKEKINFKKGEIIYKSLEVSSETKATKGFWYCDLLPDK